MSPVIRCLLIGPGAGNQNYVSCYQLKSVVHCSFDKIMLKFIPALHGQQQFPNRVIENVYVTSSGSVFIVIIPFIPRFQSVMGELYKENSTLMLTSEVWKFSKLTDKNTCSSPTRKLF
ncbi:hypothetical protein VP01_1720g2 [Puccinia sorghi]|uniref:Uncharacterized protein n=1 Tax=Puccinia sorghi TaxID=27349 RepID=A0A0L6VFH1_9BASI|nr:hypothetical protein VP01_1720g2 [Puccinia sorghi]